MSNAKQLAAPPSKPKHKPKAEVSLERVVDANLFPLNEIDKKSPEEEDLAEPSEPSEPLDEETQRLLQEDAELTGQMDRPEQDRLDQVCPGLLLRHSSCLMLIISLFRQWTS